MSFHVIHIGIESSFIPLKNCILVGNCKRFCWVILTHSTCLLISVGFHIWMELTFIIYLILFVIILDGKSLIHILTTPLTVVKLLLHSFLWFIALISDSCEWQIFISVSSYFSLSLRSTSWCTSALSSIIPNSRFVWQLL